MLDIATGPGVLLTELARASSQPDRAWGIDSSPEMLSLAPALPAAWRLSVADATSLPFDDSSFDVVTSSYLLHVLSVQDRRRVIDEIGRVLRPTGRVGTITIAPPRGPIAAAISAPVRIAARRS
ncbi:MAG: class I SAM-dependent methyltransferase, partial [Solirubrobacterales bacterium]